jgi:hypothetical protein
MVQAESVTPTAPLTGSAALQMDDVVVDVPSTALRGPVGDDQFGVIEQAKAAVNYPRYLRLSPSAVAAPILLPSSLTLPTFLLEANAYLLLAVAFGQGVADNIVFED